MGGKSSTAVKDRNGSTTDESLSTEGNETERRTGEPTRPGSTRHLPAQVSTTRQDSEDSVDWKDALDEELMTSAVQDDVSKVVCGATGVESSVDEKFSDELKISKDVEIKSEYNENVDQRVNGGEENEEWTERDRGVLTDARGKYGKTQKKEERYEITEDSSRKERAREEKEEHCLQDKTETIKLCALDVDENVRENKLEINGEISKTTNERDEDKDTNDDKKAIDKKNEEGEDGTEADKKLFDKENDATKVDEAKNLLRDADEDKATNGDKKTIDKKSEDDEKELSEANVDNREDKNFSEKENQVTETNKDNELLREVNANKEIEITKGLLSDSSLEDQTEIEGRIQMDSAEVRAIHDVENVSEFEQGALSCDSVGERETVAEDGGKATIDSTTTAHDNKIGKLSLKFSPEEDVKIESKVGDEERKSIANDASSCSEKNSETNSGGNNEYCEPVSVDDATDEKEGNLESKAAGDDTPKEPPQKKTVEKDTLKGKKTESVEDCDNDDQDSSCPSDSSEMGDKTKKKSRKTEARWKLGKKMLGRGPSTLDFDNFDPCTCVAFLRSPTPKTYAALNRKLKNCDRKWMTGFLEENGLDALLASVDSISSRKIQLADAMMLLECVACIKTVMNSKIGLQVITERREYVEILLSGEEPLGTHWRSHGGGHWRGSAPPY